MSPGALRTPGGAVREKLREKSLHSLGRSAKLKLKGETWGCGYFLEVCGSLLVVAVLLP